MSPATPPAAAPEAKPADAGGAAPGFPKLVPASLALLLVGLWPTWPQVWAMWFGDGVMLPGMGAVALVIWLVWKDRHALKRTGPGLEVLSLLAAVLSVLWLAATVMGILLGLTGVVPLLLLSWAGAALGLPALLRLLPLGAVAYLSVPVWDVFIRPLQSMTVLVSGTAVRLMGIEAEILGDTITIQSGTFLVEGSCAGLAFLVSGLVVGVAYAFLFVPGWWARLVVVGVAAAYSIVSNWVRVTALIVAGESSEMQSSLMTDHGWLGWVIFSIALVPFFATALRIERWDRARVTPAAAEARAGGRGADPELQARAAVDPAHGDPGLVSRTLLATGAALLGPALYTALTLLPASPQASAQVEPGNDWREAPVSAAPTWTLDYPPAEEHEERAFRRGDEVVITRRLTYGRQQVGVELVSSLNRLAPEESLVQERVIGPLDPRGRRVREAWIRSEGQLLLAWYWYRVADVDTASGLQAKLLELLAFVTRRREVELVVLGARCAPDDCSQAARTLFEFATGQPAPPLQGGASGD